MLALATTTVHVTTRKATPERDAHGAPKPGAAAARGPYDAHRTTGRLVLTDAGAEVRGARWDMDATAWPIVKGDVIVDDRDSTRWTVEGVQLVPSGLGLDQVQADCSQLHPEAG